MVKMPRTFQNHQSNAGCSNFFNLKPNAGTKTNFSTSTQKSKRFFGSQVTASRTQKELAVVKKKQNKKVYGKLHRRVFLFQKWEISLVHYKRGYSGPGMLGEFVVVLLMWCLGAPSILIVCYYMCNICLYINIKKNYVLLSQNLLPLCFFEKTMIWKKLIIILFNN